MLSLNSALKRDTGFARVWYNQQYNCMLQNAVFQFWKIDVCIFLYISHLYQTLAKQKPGRTQNSDSVLCSARLEIIW